jgi:hypothetical protein
MKYQESHITYELSWDMHLVMSAILGELWSWYRKSKFGTPYPAMVIPRVVGQRREVRRMLARRSQELLARYGQGYDLPLDSLGQQALPKLQVHPVTGIADQPPQVETIRDSTSTGTGLQ